MAERKLGTASPRIFHDNLLQAGWSDLRFRRMDGDLNSFAVANCPPSGEMPSPDLRRFGIACGKRITASHSVPCSSGKSISLNIQD